MNRIRPFRFGVIGLALAIFIVGCDKPDPQSTQPEQPTQPVQPEQPTQPAQPTQPKPDSTAAAEHGTLPKTAGSFNTAKKWLYEKVYYDHRLTFYCGCQYSEGHQVELSSCGVTPRKNADRAQRIEAEHVFPASQFGNFRQCWREPGKFPDCVNKKGKILLGRKCCEKVDLVFEAAHNDLHNLFPTVGEVNGDRSNFNWGMIPGEKRSYGECNIEVDPSIRRAEPPESVMGDIARTMFYMSDTYGFRLSRQDQQLYTAWNRMDPPDAWEIERNRRIAAIQGLGNKFIEGNAVVSGKADESAGTIQPVKPAPQPEPKSQVQKGLVCGNKTKCGEMKSCEEATFYLNQCGLSRLDQNGDDVPCESLCR
ncbi:MAG: endonuclease [Candidatus Competibacteraceae bacterium]|jgi:deoxyribonuclease-1|nr:endonuclease [Candidatus Competibacteraceae bacterium]